MTEKCLGSTLAGRWWIHADAICTCDVSNVAEVIESVRNVCWNATRIHSASSALHIRTPLYAFYNVKSKNTGNLGFKHFDVSAPAQVKREDGRSKNLPIYQNLVDLVETEQKSIQVGSWTNVPRVFFFWNAAQSPKFKRRFANRAFVHRRVSCTEVTEAFVKRMSSRARVNW